MIRRRKVFFYFNTDIPLKALLYLSSRLCLKKRSANQQIQSRRASCNTKLSLLDIFSILSKSNNALARLAMSLVYTKSLYTGPTPLRLLKMRICSSITIFLNYLETGFQCAINFLSPVKVFQLFLN